MFTWESELKIDRYLPKPSFLSLSHAHKHTHLWVCWNKKSEDEKRETYTKVYILVKVFGMKKEREYMLQKNHRQSPKRSLFLFLLPLVFAVKSTKFKSSGDGCP